MHLPASVDIREVGLRDGLQLEEPLPTATKLRLLAAVAATGVRRVEVTSFVSRSAVPALADAEDVVAALGRWPDIVFSALVAGVGGARRAVAAGMPHLEYLVSAADGHSRANAGRSSDEAVAAAGEVAGLAHASGGRCEAIIAVAWDCPLDGPTPVARVVDVARRCLDSGADALCLGDTIGTAMPGRVAELLDRVRSACPGVEVGVHFHNSRGAGLPNVLAALDAGVTQVDASVGGARWLPVRPRGQRQHRHRGAGLPSRGLRRVHRPGPRCAAPGGRRRGGGRRARPDEQPLPRPWALATPVAARRRRLNRVHPPFLQPTG